MKMCILSSQSGQNMTRGDKSEKYNEYLRKINELNKIIDEKDKLIVKLLSKKR